MDQSSADTSLSDDVYQQVVNLLELVKTSSTKTPEAMALFMDELSSVINQGIIDSKVEVRRGAVCIVILPFGVIKSVYQPIHIHTNPRGIKVAICNYQTDCLFLLVV